MGVHLQSQLGEVETGPRVHHPVSSAQDSISNNIPEELSAWLAEFNSPGSVERRKEKTDFPVLTYICAPDMYSRHAYRHT